MNLWKFLYRLAGWKTAITVPYRDKCVICVAPHTSNLDFIAGLFAYRSVGRKAGFLMKDFWFFFPLGYLLRALGGIPVYRSQDKGSLTKYLVRLMTQSRHLNLAVTPEGTRSAVDKWKTGFLYIAYGSSVPVQLGVIDFKNKCVIIEKEYFCTQNMEEDMAYIKSYYSQFKDVAKYPENFIV